jgi:hypothetical protein
MGIYQQKNHVYKRNLYTYPSAFKVEKGGEQQEERTFLWRHCEFTSSEL